MHDESISSRRREFLSRAAAGSAVLLVAGAGTACAAPASEPSGQAMLPGDGEWLSKLHGAHRQYFDVTSWNDGFGQVYAVNWASSMKSTYGLTDADVCAVIGMRHMGIAPAFNDTIWAKYKFGEFFRITDPKTKQPSVRNFAYTATDGDFPLPGVGLSTQIPAGAVVTVCNLATTVLSGATAAAAGVGVSPEEAYEEFKANLQPGCHLVPTGVLAVNRAQSAGDCTYCYAG